MKSLLYITLVGFISGVAGTGLGGLFVFFVNIKSPRFMGVLLGFTSGVMLSVVTFDLLPQAFSLANIFVVYFGISMGAFLIIAVDSLLGKSISSKSSDDLVKSGTLMAIAIALHNFPEGLAVGSGFAAATGLGISLAVVIALHDMPEGIAMALPLKMGGINRCKILLYTLLAGIPNGIGAFIGGILGQISPALIAVCLGVAAGSMIYITCGELIPKTYDMHRGRISTLGLLFGLMCGIYVSKMI